MSDTPSEDVDPALDPALDAALDGPARPAVPARLADAVERAREAAVDLADGATGEVGAHVTVRVEDDTVDAEGDEAVLATHYFAADKPGYRGWYWAVTLAAADEGPATVSEVVLLPGPDAVTAPTWLPWTDRVRAEDLSPGDLLPVDADDERLVPAHAALDPDDPALTDPDGASASLADELGLGRARVMSVEGRLDAAVRWGDGDFGPGSEMARSVSATCGTCGFYLRLAGGLRAAFGVCGNEQVPADGHVVHVGYGCGGHSELQVDTGALVAVSDVVYDDGVEMEPVPSP